MNRRRARILALAGSTAVAVGILALAWPHLRQPAQESVRFHRIDPPPAGQASEHAAPASVDDAALDPTEPEKWRYYLTEEQANRWFAFRGDNRQVYDPWVYYRDAGNLDDVFRRPEHPDKRWRWKTNSLGCREDHELDNPPRKLRILVAGDSHTCGLCNNNESFPNLLEASLALEHSTTVEVLNTGLGGYSFHNYFGTLLRFRTFEPQVFVVSVFGGNDFAELLMLDHEFTGRPWGSLSAEQQERRTAALAHSSDAMGQGLNALDTFRAWPDEQPAMVQAAVELCAQLKRVTERNHSKLIVVFIPASFDFTWKKLPGRAVEARAALELSSEDEGINRRMAASFLDGLGAAGVQALDMRPLFERESGPPYWELDFHLNLRGHRLVADALQPLIDEALAKK